MRYWDSSALVALIVEQAETNAVRDLYSTDGRILSWTTSEIEIISALCRLHREGSLDARGLGKATERLAKLWSRLDAISAVDAVKVRAARALRTHTLRAADALQLGAALLVAADDAARWSFVCLDDRLAGAALREGFTVLPPPR
jgi:predicted nucleic acid-binding protein